MLWKLPTVRQFMDTELPNLGPDMALRDAVEFLLDNGMTGAPVVRDGRLMGILSEKDCLRLLTHHELGPDATVADVMTTEVTTATPDMDIYFAAGTFLKNSFRRMPVLEKGMVIGHITRRDILRGIKHNLAALETDEKS